MQTLLSHPLTETEGLPIQPFSILSFVEFDGWEGYTDSMPLLNYLSCLYAHLFHLKQTMEGYKAAKERRRLQHSPNAGGTCGPITRLAQVPKNVQQLSKWLVQHSVLGGMISLVIQKCALIMKLLPLPFQSWIVGLGRAVGLANNYNIILQC